MIRFRRVIRYWLSILLAAIATISISCNDACAQKYNFSHYDVENGLLQSQVNMMVQDNAHRLWIATLGGACRFDGREYFNISKSGGLLSNLVYSVFTDKEGTVWFGTHNGLARFKNNRIYNFPTPAKLKNSWATQVLQDGKGVMWVIIDERLFKIKNDKLETVVVSGFAKDAVTVLTTDKQGDLYAATYMDGIYHLKGDKWISMVHFPKEEAPQLIREMAFDRRDERILYLLAPKGLFVLKDGIINPYIKNGKPNIDAVCLSFEQDAENNMWIGTGVGAFYFRDGSYLYFNGSNGFSDNPVTDIYTDADNNLWLGTSGNGVFKYEGDNYVTYAEKDGIKHNQVVMGIARDRNNAIILGTDAGLVKDNDGKFSPLSDKEEIGMVQSLLTDSKGNLWIGSGAAWKYDGRNFERIKGTEKRTIVAFAEDERGTIWIGTPTGCMYYQDGKVGEVASKRVFASSLMPIGKDSLLAGTQEGLMLIVNKKWVPGFKLPLPANTAVFCMVKIKNGILIGTDDRGILLWNRKNNTITNYTDKDGLKSNVIYSLVMDNKGIVWAGSGRGVNRVEVNTQTMQCRVLRNYFSNDPVIESNQNAALYYNNKVYIGTAKGLTMYNTGVKPPSQVAPHVLIQSIKFFEQDKTINKAALELNDDLRLSASQNHLSIAFLGVYLVNPKGVTYQYKLVGLEDKFSLPVATNTVDYPALPPGMYRFEVRAISPEGVVSNNTASFSFEIVPPFYQTTLFRMLTGVFIILLIIAAQSVWHYNKKKHELVIEAIKQQEKIKIRQQTAEDFHDDLGNKLTRITVLSEMLNIKIDKDKPDQQQLVDQIKQNAVSLYNGTKDILWALDPKSDNLYETLKHIEEIGNELFRDTAITFINDAADEDFRQVKLTMEYNRNITMIFKELLNNALKHAGAREVILTASQSNEQELSISLSDDGKGFECSNEAKGHGLKNIKNRAGRINGELKMSSAAGKGTKISLKFLPGAKLNSTV